MAKAAAEAVLEEGEDVSDDEEDAPAPGMSHMHLMFSRIQGDFCFDCSCRTLVALY